LWRERNLEAARSAPALTFVPDHLYNNPGACQAIDRSARCWAVTEHGPEIPATDPGALDAHPE
jgi:hypothetical protein